MEYLIVALLGASAGAIELASRYRDNPLRALQSPPALLYLTINAAASALTLRLFAAHAPADAATRIMLAGFAGMAILRTSLFTIRAGEHDVAVGPGSILQLLLQAIDREVDRRRATVRAQCALSIMRHVSFARAYDVLPVVCMNLMQNLSSEDSAKLGEEIRSLRQDPMAADVKVVLLGLFIINCMGEEVLRTAVEQLGPLIREPEAAEQLPAGQSGRALGQSGSATPVQTIPDELNDG